MGAWRLVDRSLEPWGLGMNSKDFLGWLGRLPKLNLQHSHYLIILYAIVLHLTWAVLLLIDADTGFATAVHTLEFFVVPARATDMYLSVAVFALVGLIYPKGIFSSLCLLPQQLVMMISAGGAAWAMWLGQFADGVQRSHSFIIADQAPAVIAAILHTYAVVMIARENSR